MFISQHSVAFVNGSPFPSLLYPTLWISVCSRRWRTLKELITGWICLPPFHFPLLSFWPPLSPASFFSSLYNSVNISEWSSCGVHIRKWLLASPLSPLLIPPHLIWVTSNSLLPLLLLYSTIDKTSTLKMKCFFTVRATQRGSQRYTEKRRGRRELELTQMRWGGINRGESRLASNHFLMCTPQLDRSGCSRNYTEKRRRRKETEVARRIKGGM